MEASALFLDRDGVINRRPLNEYVRNWSQFEFLPGVLDAIRIFTQYFNRIIIVTNQQGIGKMLMTHEDVGNIHRKMLDEIHLNHGRIDAIYYCPDLASKADGCRKPGLKMAEMAKNDFPDIKLSSSVMVGDTASDMQFGRNAGMTTIFVGSEIPDDFKALIDQQFNNLLSFAQSLVAND